MVLFNSMLKLERKSKTKLTSEFFNKVVIILLEVATFLIIMGFVGGLIKSFLDLRFLISTTTSIAIRYLIIDLISLLALVEILKTVFSYLRDGRVRVTYIVDTAIIIMINELISNWFSNPALINIVTLLLIVLVLVIIRVIVIRISPEQHSKKT
ncbi:MAG: phosphate-starvation-inducible PsiE family protein [Candidatus Berkelbacteria bacterium]